MYLYVHIYEFSGEIIASFCQILEGAYVPPHHHQIKNHDFKNRWCRQCPTLTLGVPVADWKRSILVYILMGVRNGPGTLRPQTMKMYPLHCSHI